MNRRNFIRTGTMLLALPAISKITGFGSSKLYAATNTSKKFSIELITDKADKAIPMVEKLINDNFISAGLIKYSEFTIDGAQNGDIIYFDDGKLINYKAAEDGVSKKLREISNKLDLPKAVDNPLKIRFSSTAPSASAEKYLVIHNGTIIEELTPGITSKSIEIKGTNGNLSLLTSDNTLRVTKSSCRHKTCIESGSISKSGEYIVCIPNEIVIMAQ
ncbi:MAG: NusG domain II-containing protein [Ignavibacteria bacterium]